MAKMTPNQLTVVSKRINNTAHNVGKTIAPPRQRSNQKRLTQAANGEEDTDSNPLNEEILHQTPEIQRENTPDSTLWKTVNDNPKTAPLLAA